MTTVTIVSPPHSGRDRKRHTAAAARQRKARKAQAYRRRCGDPVVGVRVRPVVIDALIAQGVDSGLTEAEAEAETRDRAKVADLLDQNSVEWAQRYLEERKRHR